MLSTSPLPWTKTRSVDPNQMIGRERPRDQAFFCDFNNDRLLITICITGRIRMPYCWTSRFSSESRRYASKLQVTEFTHMLLPTVNGLMHRLYPFRRNVDTSVTQITVKNVVFIKKYRIDINENTFTTKLPAFVGRWRY